MRDAMWTGLVPAQSLSAPPAPCKNVQQQTHTGWLWHEQGSQYTQDPLMCVQGRCWQQDCSAPLRMHWGF